MEWAVATTQPACEAKASADLVSVGFTAYYPKIEHVEAVRGRIVKRVRPLFPGYLFFELIEAWREVFRFDRILGVLMWSAEEPAHLPHSVIDDLLGRAGPDGVIKVEARKRRRFRIGQTVRMKQGPFVGFSGLIDNMSGDDRVKVLLDLFGRMTPITVAETELAA